MLTILPITKMDNLLKLYPDHLLIIEAIKVTADKGKSNMEYIEAILRNWRNEKGINNYAHWQLKGARFNTTTKQSYERPGDNEYDGLLLQWNM